MYASKNVFSSVDNTADFRSLEEVICNIYRFTFFGYSKRMKKIDADCSNLCLMK